MQRLHAQREEEIVNNFLKEHKISKDDAESKQKVGEHLAKWIQPNGKVDLMKLPQLLEDAYALAFPDRKEDQEEGEDIAGDVGKMKGTPGKTTTSKTPQLTPQEKEVARKMGISESDYAENKQKIAADIDKNNY